MMYRAVHRSARARLPLLGRAGRRDGLAGFHLRNGGDGARGAEGDGGGGGARAAGPPPPVTQQQYYLNRRAPPPEARPVGRTGRTVNITGRARERARVKTDLSALLLLLTALVWF